MNWLQLVLSLSQLLPSILQSVTAVESAVGRAHGKQKKAIVMAPFKVAPPEVQAVIGSVVDDAVEILNATGSLGKPAPTPIPDHGLEKKAA